MEASAILLVISEAVLLAITLFDLFKRKFKNLTFGLVWLLIIFIFPIIGPLMYLFLRKGMSAGKPRTFNPKFHREAQKEINI